MATPTTYTRNQAIQRSFDLLCEYLNFGDDFATGAAGLVRHVLCSPFVRPFFDEYTRDCLMPAEEIEDIDFHALLSLCQKKNVFRSKVYSTRGAVNKSSWTALDHAARFVVQMLQYSWRHDGPWDHGRFSTEDDESDIEFWQAWIILRHLQAEWEAENVEDWTDDSLAEVFGQQLRLKL
ncbi:hypothetical protein SUNI508_01289 [Seiridium unicorne]|uniref:Uncharacterized protein n=1 Tax=Seiridium unicorne TaxID=138068 RepID=A0ABR2UXH5_9PEZI